MTIRLLVSAAMLLLATAASAANDPQTAASPATPAVRYEPPAPPIDQPNIQFDIVVSDEGGGLPSAKKGLTMMVQGGGSGSLRSSGVGRFNVSPGNSGSNTSVELNIDIKTARFDTREPNKIRARFTIEYQPFHPEAKVLPGRVRAQVDVMLENGRKAVLWHTADPVTGLRTAIDVTATLQK